MAQLSLPVGLSASASLHNYVVGPNAEAVSAVEDFTAGVGSRLLHLWGRPGTGKTHLAHAVCRRQIDTGVSAAYVPLSDRQLSPKLLENLAAVAVICLDDVHLIAGHAEWERALFRFYNETESQQSRLLLTSDRRVDGLGLVLGDLASRLSSALGFQLRELDDPCREQVFRSRAQEQGFVISDEVVDYVMRRHSREMSDLIQLIERLDRSTLEAGRRVTVPFVKSLLNSGNF